MNKPIWAALALCLYATPPVAAQQRAPELPDLRAFAAAAAAQDVPPAQASQSKRDWDELLGPLADDDIEFRDTASMQLKRLALASEDDVLLRRALKPWLESRIKKADDLEAKSRLQEILSLLRPSYRFRFNLIGEAKVGNELKLEVFVKNISAERRRFRNAVTLQPSTLGFMERGENYRYHHQLPFYTDFDAARTPAEEIITLDPGQEVELFNARPGFDWGNLNKFVIHSAGKHPITFAYRAGGDPWALGTNYEWRQGLWHDQLGPISPDFKLPDLKPAAELIVDVKP